MKGINIYSKKKGEKERERERENTKQNYILLQSIYGFSMGSFSCLGIIINKFIPFFVSIIQLRDTFVSLLEPIEKQTLCFIE